MTLAVDRRPGPGITGDTTKWLGVGVTGWTSGHDVSLRTQLRSAPRKLHSGKPLVPDRPAISPGRSTTDVYVAPPTRPEEASRERGQTWDVEADVVVLGAELLPLSGDRRVRARTTSV